MYHLMKKTGMKLVFFYGNKLKVEHPGNSVCFVFPFVLLFNFVVRWSGTIPGNH